MMSSCSAVTEWRTAMYVAERLAPTISGPSVITAQYMKMFCASERRRCTRKMRFSALSTVSISITDVTAKPNTPIAVRRPTLRVNELTWSITVSIAGRVRQHVVQDEELQRGGPLVEDRKGGRHGERHREQRHERKQRGVSEAARRLRDALFAEAVDERDA